MTTKSYFELEPEEQRTICLTGRSDFNMAAIGIEKDVWICWALATLFRLPEGLPMAFKGGTSLSKVFDVIHRLSEDVDVTVDFRSLGPIPENISTLSRSQGDKLRARLEQALKDFTANQVIPWLRAEALRLPDGSAPQIDLDPSGDKVFVKYPSAFRHQPGDEMDEAIGDYIRPEIILEFGGRNTTEPKETHTVEPYVARLFPGVGFPSAKVGVLSPKRTFWEKATLIHLECNKPVHRTEGKGERIARHWADLASLADHRIGREAITDVELAESVVRHKSVFFRDRDANYDACLTGSLRLVPPEPKLKDLEKDHKKMEGMFQGNVPDFEIIIRRLGALESEINAHMLGRLKPPMGEA